VHYSEIDGYGFRSLEENQHVEFEVTQGPKGLHRVVVVLGDQQPLLLAPGRRCSSGARRTAQQLLIRVEMQRAVTIARALYTR
jgi:hypothetical protein